MAAQLFLGSHFFLDGFKLIFRPGLKRFLLIPLLLNILLFSAMFWVTHHYFNLFTHWLESYLPHWLYWIENIFWVLFFLIFSIAIVYSFVTLANLFGAPFNSLLAEKVEFYLTGKKEEVSLFTTIKDTPRIVARQFAILGYYAPRAVGLLILFFIPFVQVLAAPLFFLFNAWFLALQNIDYPTDNHRIPLAEVKNRLKENRILVLTFGISVLVCSMIPIVNFFVVPAAVAGATKLWITILAKES